MIFFQIEIRFSFKMIAFFDFVCSTLKLCERKKNSSQNLFMPLFGWSSHKKVGYDVLLWFDWKIINFAPLDGYLLFIDVCIKEKTERERARERRIAQFMVSQVASASLWWNLKICQEKMREEKKKSMMVSRSFCLLFFFSLTFNTVNQHYAKQ